MKKLLTSFLVILFVMMVVVPVSHAEDRWRLIIDDDYIVHIDIFSVNVKQINSNEAILTFWCKMEQKASPEKNTFLIKKTSYKFVRDTTDIYEKTLATYVYVDNKPTKSHGADNDWEIVVPGSNTERIFVEAIIIWGEIRKQPKVSS